MIKGIGKRIVLLNNTDSELFEQAIFILKNDNQVRHKDMVKECERMMNQNLHNSSDRDRVRRWKIRFFIAMILSVVLFFLSLILAVI